MIAIIAILAGMLLPALSSAREKGRSVSCINNLKTNGILTAMYRDDYNNFLYAPHPAASITPVSWGAMLVQLKLAQNYKAMRCPSNKDKGTVEGLDIYGGPVDTGEFGLYGFNLNKPSIFRKENKVVGAIQSLSNIYQLADSRQVGSGKEDMFAAVRASVGDTNASWGRILLAHRDSANVLFLDGHASSVQHKQIFNNNVIETLVYYGSHQTIVRDIGSVMDGGGNIVSQ